MTQQYTEYPDTVQVVYMTKSGKYLQFYCASGWDPNQRQSAREVETLAEATVASTLLHRKPVPLMTKHQFHDSALKAIQGAIPLRVREERTLIIEGAMEQMEESEHVGE